MRPPRTIAQNLTPHKARSAAMAYTLVRAENCAVLRKKPRLAFEKDGYSYEIVRDGDHRFTGHHIRIAKASDYRSPKL